MRRTPTTKTGSTPAGLNVNIFTGNLHDLKERIITTTGLTDSYLNNEWTGDSLSTLEHAVTKIENGDSTLLEKYQQQEQKTTARPSFQSKANYTRAEEGLFYDINLYLSGEDDHWFTEVQEQTPGRVKDLYINIALPSTTTQAEVFNKLINIVQYIDSAEGNGDRLNIYLCIQTKPSDGNKYKDKLTFNLKIKEESEPVNIQQLVYLIATPILLRFAFLLLASEKYGHYAGQCRQDDREEARLISDSSIIYIPSFYYDSAHNISIYTNLTTVYPHLKDKTQNT